jgi:hypothetical protein
MTARVYCVLMAGPFTHTETVDCLLQMLLVNSEIITEYSSWKGSDGCDGHNHAAAETLAGDFTHLLLIDRDHTFPECL